MLIRFFTLSNKFSHKIQVRAVTVDYRNLKKHKERSYISMPAMQAVSKTSHRTSDQRLDAKLGQISALARGDGPNTANLNAYGGKIGKTT